MPPAVWAILLLTIAIAIVALEMFLPSGGLLGIMAVASMLASIIVVFKYYGLMWGTLYLIFNAMLAPVVIIAALKWWPYTPIGRRMLNLAPGEEDAVTSSPTYDEYKQLAGREGEAESKMLPSGSVRIGERSYDAVSQGVAIDAGVVVRVVSVEGNRIVVLPVSLAGEVDGLKSQLNQDGTDAVRANEPASVAPQQSVEPTGATELEHGFPDPFDEEAEEGRA